MCISYITVCSPIFREVSAGDGGVIVPISSIGGYIGYTIQAFHNIPKFALEGYTKSHAKEIFPQLNTLFTIFEPGGMKTDYAKAILLTLIKNIRQVSHS